MVVRLSALRTGRALPPEISSGTHFCYRLSKPQNYGADESILILKIKTNEGNETPSVISHVKVQPVPNVSGTPSILSEADLV
jgi:hypothetical protein